MTHRLDVKADVVTVDEDGSTWSEQVTSDQSQSRRLAGAVGSKQTEALSGRHANSDTVNCRLVTVVACQVVQHDNVVKRIVNLQGE